MNSSVYVFGDLGRGYQQYPNDYTCSIFSYFVKVASANSVIAIHRNDSLMYYGYLHKLEDNSKYFGFCIVLNGVMLNQINCLQELCGNLITFLVSKGEIIKLNQQGQIIPNNSNIGEKERELITKQIQSETLHWEDKMRKLPPLNYQIGGDENKFFSINSPHDDIISSSVKYAYTIIRFEKSTDFHTLSSYQATLKTLCKEKGDLEQENKKLKGEKKQLGLVMFVSLVAVIFVIFSVISSSSLSRKSHELDSAKQECERKDGEINNLNHRISKLSSDLYSVTDKNKRLNEGFQKWREVIGSRIPIVIKDVQIANVFQDGSIQTDYGKDIYSFNSMYIKPQITYFGVAIGKEVLLNINLYTPPFGDLSQNAFSPDSCSWNRKLIIEKGDVTTPLADLGWGTYQKGTWHQGQYLLEIWYNNVCLYQKKFRIY